MKAAALGLALLALAVTSAAVGAPPAAPRLVCDKTLEDFSATPSGDFPVGWETRHKHNQAEAQNKQLYVVRDTPTDKVLHARHHKHTVTIIRPLQNWDLEEYPYLQWRWRVLKLPKGGNEARRRSNDSAAAVIVIWRAGRIFKVSTLKMTWSSTLPAGARVSRRAGRDHILVVESGSATIGQWQTESVNIAELYRQDIKSKFARPEALALTTDADDTQSEAEAQYADFRLCRIAE